jgi:hypothetical protein
MKHKSVIVMMWGIAGFIILSRWYKAGNTGLPNPQLIAAPSYLYGVLALASEFLEGLPVVLSLGVTTGLYFATHPVKETGEGIITEPMVPTPKTKAVPKNAAGKPVPQTRSVKSG